MPEHQTKVLRTSAEAEKDLMGTGPAVGDTLELSRWRPGCPRRKPKGGRELQGPTSPGNQDSPLLLMAGDSGVLCVRETLRRAEVHTTLPPNYPTPG